MKIKLKYSENPITKNEIEEVEKKYGIKLPPDLKNLLLRYNGGRNER